MVPPVVVSTPVIRLKVVLLPAPLGPISATISRAWTSKETSLTAITPPNCLRAFSICSSAPAGGRRALARWQGEATYRARLRPGLNGSRAISQGQTPVGASCSSTTSRMPNTMVSSWLWPPNSIRQIALQDLLQDDDDAGAEHRAPDIAGAADHRDEQIFDAGLRAERRRIGGALEMRIEPAGQARRAPPHR